MYYEFREVRNAAELAQVMHLRYEVYHNSRLHDFVEDSGLQCDIDNYELQAYHFGIFKVEGGLSKAVGFHRPVYDSPTGCASLVKEAVGRIGCGQEKLAPPPVPLSTISRTPFSDAVMDFYRHVKAHGKTIIESTKFGIIPAESSRALAIRIIESAIAIHMIYRNVDYAIQACTPVHAGFYALYGYRQIPGTKEFTCNGVPANTIMLKGSDIPPKVLPRLMRLAEAYAKTRRVVFNPAAHDDLYAMQTVSRAA